MRLAWKTCKRYVDRMALLQMSDYRVSDDKVNDEGKSLEGRKHRGAFETYNLRDSTSISIGALKDLCDVDKIQKVLADRYYQSERL